MAPHSVGYCSGNDVDLRWGFASTVYGALPKGTRFSATARGIDLFLIDGTIIAIAPCPTCYLVAMLIDERPTTITLGSLEELKEFLRELTTLGNSTGE